MRLFIAILFNALFEVNKSNKLSIDVLLSLSLSLFFFFSYQRTFPNYFIDLMTRGVNILHPFSFSLSLLIFYPLILTSKDCTLPYHVFFFFFSFFFSPMQYTPLLFFCHCIRFDRSDNLLLLALI